MAAPHWFLYSRGADIETADLPIQAVNEAVTLAFCEKATGRTIMPIKH